MRLIDKDNLRKPSKGMFIYQDEFEDDVQHVAFEAYTKDDIEREPTVKAIPIELIEKEMKRLDEDIKWAWYYGNTALDKMEYLKTWLTIKLEDWEKENGK